MTDFEEQMLDLRIKVLSMPFNVGPQQTELTWPQTAFVAMLIGGLIYGLARFYILGY